MAMQKRSEAYSSSGFRKTHADPNPFKQFDRWFREAEAAVPMLPEAMTLATADAQGRPSARMVLLKHFDEDGFVFFTDYRSPKAKELAENPEAALVFHWRELERQIRITGRVQRIPRGESEAYFQTRPRASQIAAHASKQSRALQSREELESRYRKLSQGFQGKEISLPPSWGGYRLAPATIEFWQHREDRLHDRLLYNRQSGDQWGIQRLSP